MLEETEEEDGESRNVQEREREVERAKVCSARRGFVSTEKKHHSLLSKATLSAIRVVSFAYLRLLIFLLAILIPACVSSSPDRKSTRLNSSHL